ncbi:MAG: VTT domain-containing protein [Myxococcota bacterium]
MLSWLALATLVSEDLTCIAAGALVAAGELGFVSASLACFAGIFMGDLLLFAAGRTLGRAALTRAPLRWLVDANALERGSAWLRRNGASVIAVARLAPGTRLPTYLAAGVLKTPAGSFALYMGLAAAAWTPALVGVSALWADGVRVLLGPHRWLVSLAGLGFVAALRIAAGALTHRGRRLLLGRVRRITRWEFWPLWLFYVPIAFRVAGLALKYRSLLLVTAVDPGIPGGGFAGESKSEILRGFGGEGERESLTFPVVLKPDVGERGSGVKFAASSGELARMARELSTDSLLQEYSPGLEFGIFYLRHPDAAAGRIFSLTEKRLISVTGDGRRNLEALILDDARAVCMAPRFLARFAARLDEVPAAGESVRLVEVGTHSQGALFLDAAEHVTPALEAAIDRLSQALPGFYFGRYDVRVPSLADLRAGRHLKVVELNGLTAEATHIYDPKHGLFFAYRVLFEQWRLAFEIAAANRARGAAPASLSDLRDLLRRRRRARSPRNGEARAATSTQLGARAPQGETA